MYKESWFLFNIFFIGTIFMDYGLLKPKTKDSFLLRKTQTSIHMIWGRRLLLMEVICSVQQAQQMDYN